MSWGDPITPENISPLALLMMLGGLGFTIKLVDQGGLLVQPRRKLPPDLATAIRRCKNDLVAMLGTLDEG